MEGLVSVVPLAVQDVDLALFYLRGLEVWEAHTCLGERFKGLFKLLALLKDFGLAKEGLELLAVATVLFI